MENVTVDSWTILFETLSFGAKALMVLVAVVVGAALIFAMSRRRRRVEPHIAVKKANDRFENLADSILFDVMEPKAFRKYSKARAKEAKKKETPEQNLFVLDFDGDMMATTCENLRHEITAIIGAAGKNDEVVIRLESPGGVVHGYGLAASQLARVKAHGLRLVACVDKMAASGGYMMACVADEIVAAPFAVVGSIGVAAPVPNVHKLLDDHGIKYEEMTAGEYKRTVSLFGEITAKGREKFQEQIEETHVLFKSFVGEHRPALAIEEVATGEYWHGTRAKELGLVDRLLTSDDYLMERATQANIFEISYEKHRSLREKLAQGVGTTVETTFLRLWRRVAASRF